MALIKCLEKFDTIRCYEIAVDVIETMAHTQNGVFDNRIWALFRVLHKAKNDEVLQFIERLVPYRNWVSNRKETIGIIQKNIADSLRK